MDRKSTYKFLKSHETGIFFGKDLPEEGLELKYLEHVEMPSSYSSYLPDDKFRISEEARDFIEQYERDYRPIIAAEKANIISIIALLFSIISLMKSYGII